MKKSSITFLAVLTASWFLFRVGNVNAQVWRCAGEDCTDVIINDIADVTVRDWPATATLAMPGLPYSCSVQEDRCPRCLAGRGTGAITTGFGSQTDENELDPIITQRVVNGTIPWSVVLAGSLQSLLFGTYTASADVSATVTSSTGESWTGTAIHYLFQGACSGTTCNYVQAPGGDTGVVDLGSVNYSTAGSTFWGDSLTFTFDVSGYKIFSCSVGYPGRTIAITSPRRPVSVAYPVAFTPVKDALAEFVRDQFRRAARLVVTGEP